jgi:uncharacterized protein (TIGR02117 family)
MTKLGAVRKERRGFTRIAAWRASVVFALTLAACASSLAVPPGAGTASTQIAVVQGEWHTDICLRKGDANAWVASLARGFDGASVLCFGFGEKRFMVEGRHDPLTMLGTLAPSEAAVVMTVLRETPEAAFGAQNVVEVSVDDAGLTSLQRYLRASIETDAAGEPRLLGTDPSQSSVYFAASGTYDAFHTCNTWTARALRSAGVTDMPDTLFASSLMRELQHAMARKPDH